MAHFATPEHWLAPLNCIHIKILRFLFRLQTVRYFIPSLCASVLQHYTVQGCTTQPPRNAVATLYHWLYWEHLMAQSWWILWAVDLLIIVHSWAVNTQIVTNHLQKPPSHSAFIFKSCKWVSFMCYRWLWNYNWWNICGDYITASESVRCSCVECGHLRMSRTLSIHHWGRGGLSCEQQQWQGREEKQRAPDRWA